MDRKYNKEIKPAQEEKKKTAKEKVRFFLLIIAAFIVITMWQDAGNILNNDKEAYWYMIAAPILVCFAFYDLQACNECYKAKWIIHDALRHSKLDTFFCLSFTEENRVNDLDKKDMLDSRNQLLNQYALSFNEKCKRMTLRIWNTFLIECICLFLLFRFTNIRQDKVFMGLFVILLIVIFSYDVLMLSSIIASAIIWILSIRN